MKEEFLHYLWKYGLYDTDSLFDNDDNRIIVIDPGEYNHDSGPDFFNARLLIGGTIWAGNVEIHIKASHFINHGHHNDQAFDNVILHVVAEKDRQVFNSRGEEILTSVISFDPAIYDKYMFLVNNPYVIACEDFIRNVDQVCIHQWLTSMVIERFRFKTEYISKIFSVTGNDWEETFYRLLARYFGFRVNTVPFEMLASALPFRIIRKHADNLFQIESLLFGTAGLLDEGLFREAVSDEYFLKLTKEYSVLSAKYSLQPMHGWLWKFSRMRPSNFPTVRISQLAAMLSASGGLFSKITEYGDISAIRSMFDVYASEYWDDHFSFGKKSRSFKKHPGSQATDILLINVVIPIIFAYGKARDYHYLCERAVSFLEEISPEENSVISEWDKAGIVSESAFYTQALLQLRNEYCRKRRCLYCSIGNSILGSGKKLRDRDQLILEP